LAAAIPHAAIGSPQILAVAIPTAHRFETPPKAVRKSESATKRIAIPKYTAQLTYEKLHASE